MCDTVSVGFVLLRASVAKQLHHFSVADVRSRGDVCETVIFGFVLFRASFDLDDKPAADATPRVQLTQPLLPQLGQLLSVIEDISDLNTTAGSIAQVICLVLAFLRLQGSCLVLAVASIHLHTFRINLKLGR